jgi:predicted acetyltransferase
METKVQRIIQKYPVINESEYLEYIKEWENTGEKIVPSTTNRKHLSFDEMKKKWEMEETKEMYKLGFVPSTLYYFIENNQRIVGAIHFRYELNDTLMHHGGHIGYGIRPSERRKGYATIMLRQLLQEIKKQGYRKVLITCDDNNLGSIGTILNCNGRLEDKVEFEGTIVRRYWVHNE